MNTQTIQQISDQIKQVEQALQSFAPGQHEGKRYGSEGEYTPQSLKAGIKAILTDLRGLVKAHNKFVQLSNHGERNTIHDCLANIVSLLTQEAYSDVANYLDTLKSIIRTYGIRGSSETQSALEERANRLNDQCSIFEDNINKIENIAAKAEQADEKFQSAEEAFKSLSTAFDELQSKHDQIANLQNLSQENHQTIESALTSAKNHENNINSFVQRVEKREAQLDKQEQTTTAYQEQLMFFEKERKEKLEEADGLIKKAREALQYTTSAGVSAAFSGRYEELKKSEKWNLLWLLGAVAFFGVAVWIGFEFLLGKPRTSPEALSSAGSAIYFAIQKITMMSVAIYAAWFCASQYTKYKNTLEDYGYKSVLAKSLIAFLDTLKGEERENYLNKVLNEIHKDPLRKRHDMDQPGPVSLLKELRKKDLKNPDMPTE